MNGALHSAPFSFLQRAKDARFALESGMPTIDKPALRDLYTKLVDTRTKVDSAVLDRIVGIVGDTGNVDSALSPEQKLQLAQKGLDAGERADLEKLLADAAFARLLDPVATNFLRAVVGLEPLRNVDRMDGASVRVDASSPQVQAAQQLRELIKSGEIKRYYDAAIGAVDDAALKARALALFDKLPVVKPGMSGNDFVRAGLWTTAPRGVEEMQNSARYLPGRQVLCATTVFAKVPAESDPGYERERRKVGTYDPNGPVAVTYRATLVGQDPANADNFLVKVDGADKPISVTKQSIIEQNQPFTVDPSRIQSDVARELPFPPWGTWNIDYSSSLAKAKLAEIAIRMDDVVKKLDFTKMKTEAAGGVIGAVFGRGERAREMVELQKDCVEIIFKSIDMKYPRDDGREFTDPGRAGRGVNDAARQAIRGTGMCVQQSSVFGALLMPFMDVLGVDGQFRKGNCFRNIRGATPNVFARDYMSPHGWWQLTFRPSMTMTVTDRTWDQVNLDLDRAYGFPYGDRYAHQNIDGYVTTQLKPTDVNVSGDVSVQTLERQFSQRGDGRENHISRHNRD